MYAYLKLWFALKNDRRAVTALEYGLIAALIAGVIISSVSYLGTNISSMFGNIANHISTANSRITNQ